MMTMKKPTVTARALAVCFCSISAASEGSGWVSSSAVQPSQCLGRYCKTRSCMAVA